MDMHVEYVLSRCFTVLLDDADAVGAVAFLTAKETCLATVCI